MNHIFTDDIICAPATIPGTGAISVVRISGKGCLGLCDRVVSLKKGKLSDAAGYTLHYGTVFYRPEGAVAAGSHSGDGTRESLHSGEGTGCRENGAEEVLDDVVVSVFRAPHSYTGEDSVEISCHSSKYIVEQLIQLLVGNGARVATPGEFTRRAFLNGKMDLAQAEAVADVIASSSEASHRVAMSQMKGGFSQELSQMRSELLELVTLMELELDFSEEDVEFADRSRLTALVDRTSGHVTRLADSFRLGNALRNGVPVAIVGATNAGKSTLLNSILGEERAIVSDIDGTTRDTIEETLNIDGILFRFIDTAGLRESDDTIERIGIERSYRKLSEASLVIALLDATKPDEVLSAELSRLLPLIDFRQQRLFIALNKIDAISPKELNNKNVFVQNFIVSSYNFKGDIAKDSGAGADADAGANPRSGADAGPDFDSDSRAVLGSSSGADADPDSDSNSDVGVGSDSGADAGPDSDSDANPGQPGQDAGKTAVLSISAKAGAGIPELKTALADSQKSLNEASTEQTLVTNLRHWQALTAANKALSRVRSGLDSGIPADLLAQDLREAIDTLGEIVGAISSQEVLNTVFSRFCIGK